MINSTASLAIGTVLALSAIAWVVSPLLARELPAMTNPEPITPATSEPSPESAAVSDDELEAYIARARAAQKLCSTCGPRPQPDAVFCSDCGKPLPGLCRACGAQSSIPDARFCNSCGTALASR